MGLIPVCAHILSHLGAGHIGGKDESATAKRESKGTALGAVPLRQMSQHAATNVRLTTSLLGIEVCNAFPQRIERGLRPVRQVQLAEDVADVGAHRPLRDKQRFPNLRIG